MAEFNPRGNPHAVNPPQAESLSQLYQFIIQIREHLSEFTTAWGSRQPDCPRASSGPGYFIVPIPIEHFASSRRRECADAYRDAVRAQVLRLWKPGIDPPPAQHRYPEEDLFDVITPWIMQAINREAGRAASETDNSTKSSSAEAEQDDFKLAKWFDDNTTVSGASLRQAVSEGKFLRSVGPSGKKRYSLADAKAIWGSDIVIQNA